MHCRDWWAQDKRQSSERKSEAKLCAYGMDESRSSWVMANENHLDTCFTYVNNFTSAILTISNGQSNSAWNIWIPVHAYCHTGSFISACYRNLIFAKSFNQPNKSWHLVYINAWANLLNVFSRFAKTEWVGEYASESKRARERARVHARCSWVIYRNSNRFALVRFEKYVTGFLTFALVFLSFFLSVRVDFLRSPAFPYEWQSLSNGF